MNYDNIDNYAPIAFWLLIDNQKYSRNRLILGSINMGIPTGSFNYNTIIKNDYFKKFIINKDDKMNNSQYVRDNSIFLPLYETLSEDDIRNICKSFKYVLDRYEDENEIIFDEKVYDESISYFDGFYMMRK